MTSVPEELRLDRNSGLVLTLTMLACALLVIEMLLALNVAPWSSAFWPYAFAVLLPFSVIVAASLGSPMVSVAALLMLLTLVPRTFNIDLGVAVTVDRALAPVLLLGTAACLMGGPRLRLNRWEWWFVVLACANLGWLLFVLPKSHRVLESLFHPVYRAAFLPLVAAAAWTASARARRMPSHHAGVRLPAAPVVLALCGGVLLSGLLGAVEIGLDGYLLSDGVIHRRGDLLRAVSTLENPLVFGAVVAMASPLALGIALAKRQVSKVGFVGWMTLAVLTAILSNLSLSRSSMLGLIVGVATVVFALYARGGASTRLRRAARRSVAAFVLAAGVAALAAASYAFLVKPEEFLDRWAADNVSHRLVMFLLSIRLLAESPMTGVGLMGFERAAKSVKFLNYVQSPFEGQFLTAHNAYLQAAVEAGLPAAILLAALTLLPVGLALHRLFARRGRTIPRGERAYLGGLAGSMLVAVVCAFMFDLFGWLVPSVIYFAVAGFAMEALRNAPVATGKAT